MTWFNKALGILLVVFKFQGLVEHHPKIKEVRLALTSTGNQLSYIYILQGVSAGDAPQVRSAFGWRAYWS